MNDENFRQESRSADDLSGPLRQAVIELRGVVPPSEALARVIDRAIELPIVQPQTRPSRHWLRYSLAAAAAAAALVAFGVRLFAPSDTWAQVVKEVQMKPWIHGVAQLPDKKKWELWISFPREVSGDQFEGGSTLFDDWKTKVRYQYLLDQGETKGNTLYREPLPPALIKAGKDFEEMFLGAMRGDKNIDSALPGLETISREFRTVIENDKTWTEYDFVLRNVSRAETIRFVLRVDPKTNLPTSMKTSSLSGGITPTQEFTFDYPDEDAGPRDIYDLGVPRTAKLVDRMPSEDLAHVISAVHLGQQQFGSYFAIVAHCIGNSNQPWQAIQFDLVWRKGKKFRVEQAFIRTEKLPTRLADTTDFLTYWKDKLNAPHNVFLPWRVCDGNVVWILDSNQRPQVENGQLVQKWKEFHSVRNQDDFNTWVGCISMETMPDVMAYGVPPIPAENQEVKLLNGSDDGPAGCVLAEIRQTREQPNAYHLCRYWYDPLHADVMRKFEYGDLRPLNKDALAKDIYESESIAQTPSGVWYPTCIHRVTGPKPEDGYYLWYFVDFHAKLPDSLFKPEPRTGEIP
jgi:hypothetical protein